MPREPCPGSPWPGSPWPCTARSPARPPIPPGALLADALSLYADALSLYVVAPADPGRLREAAEAPRLPPSRRPAPRRTGRGDDAAGGF